MENVNQHEFEHAVAICLNGEEILGRYGQAYEDRWGINSETGDLHAFVRGQRQGTTDHYIEDAAVNGTPVYFYTRPNSGSNLVFRGIGRVTIERPRAIPKKENATNDQCALFYLKIDSEELRATPLLNKKRGVLEHFGLPNGNIVPCFYKR